MLTRLETAFSRDSAGKLYVQDRMRENAADLWKWIGDGSYLYVCGDASRMALDVDEALRGIIAQHGGQNPKSAATYLQAMSAEGRYVRGRLLSTAPWTLGPVGTLECRMP